MKTPLTGIDEALEMLQQMLENYHFTQSTIVADIGSGNGVFHVADVTRRF